MSCPRLLVRRIYEPIATGLRPTLHKQETLMNTSNTPNQTIQPYLSFEGRCEEAAAFYQKALGAEVMMLMRFKDCPEKDQSGGCGGGAPDSDKVMHMALRIGNSVIFASDGRCAGTANFQGISLSLSAQNEAEAERFFTALAEGGEVQMPLAKTFFASRFGMVVDRFGVSWMVIVTP
jgi:PhnB protein